MDFRICPEVELQMFEVKLANIRLDRPSEKFIIIVK